MKNFSFNAVAFAVVGLCVSLIPSGNALNLETVMEGSCSEMTNLTTTEFVNQTWIRTAPRWFLLGASKFTSYRATLHHFDEDEEIFAEIPEHRLYYESCLIYDIPENGTGRAVLSGYEPGRQSFYNLVEVAPGVDDFFPLSFNMSNPRNFSRFVDGASRHYVTLTDNESFLVFNNCFWGPDQKGWGVLSPTPTLPQETMDRIEEHLLDQGFDPDYFIFFRFNSCLPGVLNQPSPWATTTTTTTTSTTTPPPTTNVPVSRGGTGRLGWGRG